MRARVRIWGTYVAWGVIRVETFLSLIPYEVRTLATSARQVHEFSYGDRRFTVDPASLVLSEQQSGPAGRSEGCRRVTDAQPSARDLEVELQNLCESRRTALDHLYLNISHSCNMACRYCFASGGAYGGPEELMPPQTAAAAIDWIVRFGRGKRLVVHFFGGEPLLNLPVLRQTVAYGRRQCSHNGKGFQIRISTNGTRDLRELSDVLFSVQHRISVSVDGPPLLHNHNRPFRDGRPTHRAIAGNVRRFIELAGASSLSAKATWTHGRSDLVSIARGLLNLGFLRLNIARETSVRASDGWPQSPNGDQEFEEIVAAYERLAIWYVGQLNRGRQFVLQPLHSIMHAVLLARVVRHTCTAGVSTWCVSPNGSIHPCHRFLSHTGYRVGRVTGESPDQQVVAKLSPYGAFPSTCDRCWAKYWCLSSSCVYLSSVGQDYSQLEGFCGGMCHYMEMICFCVATLSDVGRRMLRQVGPWPESPGQ